MTANEFEKKIDEFFEVFSAVVLDIVKFITIYIFYMSPLLPYAILGFMFDYYDEIYIGGAWLISLAGFGLAVRHWLKVEVSVDA